MAHSQGVLRPTIVSHFVFLHFQYATQQKRVRTTRNERTKRKKKEATNNTDSRFQNTTNSFSFESE